MNLVILVLGIPKWIHANHRAEQLISCRLLLMVSAVLVAFDRSLTSSTFSGASGSGDYDRAGEGDAQCCTVWVVWVLFEYGI